MRISDWSSDVCSSDLLPGRDVLPEASVNFIAAADAEASPLASRLFTVPGVEGVFLGADFVTVTKAGTRDWTELKPALLGAIMKNFMTGLPVMASSPAAVDGADEQYAPADPELVLQLQEMIVTQVRHAFAQDSSIIGILSFAPRFVLPS